jgi:phosphoribosylanthranilate isomerase
LLIDAAVPGRYGGTGHAADWDLAAKLAERYPVILAGGLSPANVAGAIGQVRPMGVDVSSGVEMDGRKHDQLIAAFIESSARAFERLP